MTVLRGWLLLIVMAMTPPATAEPLEARIAALAPHFEIRLPEGEPPFPVALQFHGCGGKKRLQALWAEVLAEAGYAAVIVDSYAHRGIGRGDAYASVCTGLRLRGDERAGDVFAAVAWARAQPWADGDRIALVGWSHGGWTILEALTLERKTKAPRETRLRLASGEPLIGVRAAAVLYPYCGFGCGAHAAPLRTDAELLALLAGRDRVVGSRSAAKALEALSQRGGDVRFSVLAEATHAFDEPDARDLRVRYDEALTRFAHARIVAFLDETMHKAAQREGENDEDAGGGGMGGGQPAQRGGD